MALSVSGFPEPSRQSAPPNEIFSGDSVQDGFTKATLMNSPRLRGLFGATNGPTKKSDSKNQSTSSKLETEGDSNQYPVNNTTPPTTPSLSFPSSSFEPRSLEEYELELQLPMNAPMDHPKPGGPKRAQLPPLPRKITPSPVRLSPNLARLEIGGAWTRPPQASYTHSKPPPPSVVVQEWGTTGAEPSSSSVPSSRPLPSVPAGHSNDSGNLQNAVAGPSRLPSAPSVPMPTAGPSRNPNAFATSSNHINAVAGSSKHPNALMSSSLPSPTMAASPPSKVLITQTTPQQGHKSNSPSVSMRYQPLVADLAASSSDVTPNNFANISSPIRPLPRIPPTTSTSAVQTPDSSRYYPPPAKVKRPKTSPSSITGFSIPSGSKTAAPASFSRSPFDNITTTWVRPTDWNAQRANSPPLPISNGKGLPRARSHSRTRRDRSLDSSNTRATIARLNASSSPPTGGSTWVRDPYRGSLKRMPSPTIGGSRPLPKKAATLDHIPLGSKPLHILTSNMNSTTASKVFSPIVTGKRSQPPSPPTGPVKQRIKPLPSPVASPTIHAPTPNHSSRTLPALLTDVLVQPLSEAAEEEARQDQLSLYESQSMLESPLHSHPIDILNDSDSFLQPPVSPITADSPIEVFIDDQDLSTISRDHSPIRYARPDSRGNLSTSSDEDDFESSSSSSSSSRSSSPNRRRRTEQLRSYRNSYRPHYDGRSSPPQIPFRTEKSTPPPEQALEEPPKKKKESRNVRSYFGGTVSAPGTRSSSPERKSRSRQPRRLAEAVSSALEDVRNRGRGASTSPKRKSAKAPAPTAPSTVPTSVPESSPVVEESEVLDIRLPSLSRRATMETTSSSASENVGGNTGGSGRWSNAAGWARVISKKRTEGGHSSSGSLSTPYLTSNLVTAVELEGAETPYMWVSASKPPVTPAPFIPPPPSLHHRRRTDSLNLEDYQVAAGSRQQLDIEVDKHGVTCGLALGGGGGGAGAGGKAKLSDPTITSTISTSRPASSSITTTFSNFSLTGRNNKKKRTTSIAVPTPSSASAVEESFASHMEKDASSYRTRKPSEKSYPSESDLPAVVARRILRSVDQDGDVHEHEEETAVVDIIPHLRNLKVSKG